VCGTHGVRPDATDVGTRLCVSVQLLDGEWLSQPSAGEVLPIDGRALVPGGWAGGPVPFEPGAVNAPAVHAAWVDVSCFGPRRESTAIQQVRGQLKLEEHSRERWRGRLELKVEGEPGGFDCQPGGLGADVGVDFDVRSR
jgi:hypothetical protein